MNKKRFEDLFEKVNEFGKTNKGINRLAYTIEERDALKYIESLCIDEDLKTKMDDCGNLIIRREGQDSTLPAVACGSHIDTVYEGGAYDGTIGVLAGLEAIRSLDDREIKTLHPIEIIIFACEESSRFGVSTIGSKAMVGNLNIDSISNLKDRDGISFKQAFRDSNLDFESIHKCKRSQNEIKAFLELHIEQGPHLEEKNLQIGVVTGIAAPTRLKVEIKGVSSHSGATNMLNRKDSLLAAAEIALIIEKYAKQESEKGTVGTVGVLNIRDGAMNVIPGYVEMKIDIRGIHKESKEKVLQGLIKETDLIEKNRGVKIDLKIISKENPVLTDKKIQQIIIKNCESLKLTYMSMPSGAGHDAMNMARKYATGVIFVPSKDGLSHNPDEYTKMEDIYKGVELLEKTLLDLAVVVKN